MMKKKTLLTLLQPIPNLPDLNELYPGLEEAKPEPELGDINIFINDTINESGLVLTPTKTPMKFTIYLTIAGLPLTNATETVEVDIFGDGLPGDSNSPKHHEKRNIKTNASGIIEFIWTPPRAIDYSITVKYLQGSYAIFFATSLTETVTKSLSWTTPLRNSEILISDVPDRIPFGRVIVPNIRVKSEDSNGQLKDLTGGRVSIDIENEKVGLGHYQIRDTTYGPGAYGYEDIDWDTQSDICNLCYEPSSRCIFDTEKEVDYYRTFNGIASDRINGIDVLPTLNVPSKFTLQLPTQNIPINATYDGNEMIFYRTFTVTTGTMLEATSVTRCYSFANVNKQITETKKFFVDKRLTGIEIISSPITNKPYQPIIITAKLLEENPNPTSAADVFIEPVRTSPLTIIFKLGNVEFPVSSTTGTFILSLPPRTFIPGTYGLKIIYNGDKISYDTSISGPTVTVTKIVTEIKNYNVTPTNFRTLTLGTISGLLFDEEVGPLVGQIRITVNGVIKSTITTSSSATAKGTFLLQINGTELKVGSNTILTEYIPDEYHAIPSPQPSITFNVSKITTSITIGASESQITRLDTVDITGIIGEDDASAGFASPLQTTVIINVAGNQIQKQTASDGSFKVTLRGLDLPIGNNVIGVTFVETATHLGDSSNTVTVDVVKITPDLSLFTEQEKITVFEQSLISGHIEDSNNPLSNVPIKVQYLDTQEVLQTDAGGNFQVTLLGSESPLGLIGIQAIFDETEVYTTTTSAMTITVKPAVSVIEWLSPPQSVFTTIDAIFEGILKANNIALTSAPVNVSINGANESTVTTDDSGKFSFVTNFETPATYTIEAVYTGTSDRRILGDSVSFDLIAAIQPPDEYVTILDATYDDKTDVLDITLKSEFGTCMKNVPIKIKIDGKPSGEVTTDETGKATKTLGLESGTHTIVVTFDGIITPRLVCKISTKSFDVNVALYRALGRLVPISSQHIIYGVGAIIGLVVLGAVLKRLKKDDDF